MNRYLIRSLLFVLGCCSLLSSATECEGGAGGCVEVGKWQLAVALGVGVRTNPVINNDDIPLYVIPQLSYNGERFFLQNLDLGYILLEDDSHQLSLLLTPSYDQVFFRRWDVNNFVLSENLLSDPGITFGPSTEAYHKLIDTDQLRKRRMAGLAGFEYNLNVGQFDLQLHLLQEFTGYHDGQEVRMSLARHIAAGKHHWTLSGGAIWQSHDVLDYYYGIRNGEGGTLGYRYRPGSGVSGVARLDWNYRVNDSWSLTFTTAYRQLASGIRRSPIVNDDKVITSFIGGVYHF
ncbi:MAG: MipA/OmpV family protein [Cellvibrio sp.]|jgi:outer membrane protein